MPTFAVPDYKPTHSLSDFEFVHDPKDKRSKLGVGSFATVKLAKEKKTGKLYALKTIDIDSKKATKTDIQNLKTEIGIHKDLDHPNIVKFHGYIHQNNFVYLILDYAEHGNLYSHIHRKKTLTEKEIFKFFHQTCLAIDYLHQNNIIHRDLKPENLLLDKDFNIKVCDFGWSAYHINQERKTFCGTYEYMAPEIVHKKTYDYRVDIWALGILLYELIHGKAPFPGRSAQEIKASFAKCQLTFDPKVQPDAKELIQKILKDNPTSRMQIEQILSDKYVTSRLEKEQPAQKPDLKIDLRSASAGSGSKIKVPNKSLHVFTQPFSQAFNANPFIKQEFGPNSGATPKDNSCKSLQERSPNLVSPTFHHQPFSAILLNQRDSSKKTPKKLLTKKIFDNEQLSPTFNNRLDKIMGTFSMKNCSMIQPSQDITIDMGSTILPQEKTSRADLGSNSDIFLSFGYLENTHEIPGNSINPNGLKVNLPYRFERKSHRKQKSISNDLQNIVSPQRNDLKPKKNEIFNYRSVPHSQREIPESKRIKIFDNNNSFIGERNEVRRKITFRTIEEVNIAKYQGSFSDKTMFENKENVGFQMRKLGF